MSQVKILVLRGEAKLVPPRGCYKANRLSIRWIYFCLMRGDLLGSMGKQQALLLCRLPSRSPRGEIGICAVASLLCRLPFRSPRGPLQNCVPSRSCAARRAAIPFWGSRPRESKLSTAWPPKRNQHRFCDADSLIMNVLRRDRDSNPRYPFGVYTLSRRAS